MHDSRECPPLAKRRKRLVQIEKIENMLVKCVTARNVRVTAGTRGNGVTAATMHDRHRHRVHNCPYCQCERRVHQSNAEKQKAYRDRFKVAPRSSADDDWE
jgi:hypothetical protein